jgi:hypothetical protein
MGTTPSLLETYRVHCPQPRQGQDSPRGRAGRKIHGPAAASFGTLSLDEREGKVGYQYGKEVRQLERMGYLEFIGRVTSHILDKGQVALRYYSHYANAQFSLTTSS